MKRRTKKWAMLSLCAAMTLSCGFGVAEVIPSISAPVTAEETQASAVAKIGDTSYATFNEALTAANAMTGNVTVEIYDKVTLNSSFSGSYDSITFVGKDTDAEIYLDVQGYITATGKKVSFTDLILSKSAGGYLGNAGFMNVAFGVYDVFSVTYTNCTFANGAYASSGVVTFTDCTFYRSNEKYGLWAYGDVETKVENCTFEIDRGIKMYAEGAAKTVDLTVKNTDFSKVTDKPAIVLTYGESVELAGNTYSDTGVLELDLAGAPNGTAITSTDEITCVNDNGDCGVIVDGKIYQTVTDAAAVAGSGSVVTLLHDSTETVDFADGVMLNTNGYTAENVTADTELNAVAKIGYTYYETLKEAFVAANKSSGATITFMSDVTHEGKWDSRSYTGSQYMNATFAVPVTIDGNGHTLKIEGVINDGYNQLSVFRFEADATVKNLTMDLSESASEWRNEFRAISTKAGLTVDKCTFVGNKTVSKTTGIIFGQGVPADTTSDAEVVITNSTFTDWTYRGLTDNENKSDFKSVTVSGNTFTNASVYLSAYDKVTFNNNNMDESYIDVSSYSNTDGYTVTVTGNTLAVNTEEKFNEIKANPANITTDDASLVPVAKLGANTYFKSMDELLAHLTVGQTITLSDNLKLFDVLTLPAGATFNGNNFAVDGVISAGGDLTFEGYTKVTNFDAGYNKSVITIGEGATLELTGTGRMVIGHGNTFNIIGSLSNAKTADTTAVTPSLIAYGSSFTGAGVNFNVTNAYIQFNYDSTSKNSNANGTFNFNVTNSVWEQNGKFAFNVPTNGKDPTFNFNLKNSVLNSTGHIVFAVTKGDIVIDNSNVNDENAPRQLENRGNLTVKNGSFVYAIDTTSANAKKPGTLTVDNATYVGTTHEYSGSDLGIGTLIIKNNANVTLKAISNTNVYKDTDSNLYIGSADNEITDASQEANYVNTKFYVMEKYAFTLTADQTALKATESLNLKVSIDKAYYSAEYTFTYDTTKFSCAADTNDDGVIFVSNLFKGEAGVLATYTLVAKNDIQSVYEGDVFSVMGNVVQYKEQTLNGIENKVVGDTETIKISLNYTAGVKEDYVQGYSLVLVKGDDAGYAYNGVKMFYVEAYGAYAVLVEGAVTAEMIDEALSKTTNCEKIRQSYNVNAEYVNDGIIDIKDATAAYACSMLDFDVADYMELFLRADVNGDCKVNMVDVNAVIRNYTK